MAIHPLRIDHRGVDRHAADPDDCQLLEVLSAAHAALDDLELGVMQRAADPPRRGTVTLVSLNREARRRPRTGWPARSSGAEGSGPPSTQYDVWTDDEGVEHKDPVPPLSDPVGAAVITENPLVPIARRVNTSVAEALNLLNRAVSLVASTEPKTEVLAGEPGCRCCARLGVWNVVYASDRCRWCWRYWNAEGEDALPVILQAHLEGKRITKNMIDRAKREVAIVSKPKKRKRRNR